MPVFLNELLDVFLGHFAVEQSKFFFWLSYFLPDQQHYLEGIRFVLPLFLSWMEWSLIRRHEVL
jgi:hypothetical protein